MLLKDEERDKKLNILIIDDVSSNLVLLADIIREAGYIPRPVTSVRQARQAVKALLPQLILLDVTMPEINGYEYCEMLKKDVKTREIPVIFISALSSPKDRVRGFECGAVDFITKPFERAEVLVRVNTHLKSYAMQRDIEEHNKKLHRLINQQMYQITEERKNMIFALAKLVEAREDDSRGDHLLNTSKNCRLLAMSLQFTHKYEKVITNDFINTIEMASQLHDIGKIAISDRILLKGGPLTMNERAIMSRHTEIGAQTLQEIYATNEKNEFIRMAKDIAYYHHEKWDGTGYPCGLAGAKIPLAARIMAVVDTYDALINPKSYKPAFSHEAAMEIINKESGKSFDPDVVNIMNRVQRQLLRSQIQPDTMDSVSKKLMEDSRR